MYHKGWSLLRTKKKYMTWGEKVAGEKIERRRGHSTGLLT